MKKANKNVQLYEILVGFILLFCTIFRSYEITLFISAVSVIIYTVVLIFFLRIDYYLNICGLLLRPHSY